MSDNHTVSGAWDGRVTLPDDGAECVPCMTLRDWFAGQALAANIQGAIARGLPISWDVAARAGYEVADAMLAERAK